MCSALVYLAPALSHPGARDMELLLPALVRRRRLLLLLTCASQLSEFYQQGELAAAGEEARGKWLAALQAAAAEQGVSAEAVSVLLVEMRGGLRGQGLAGALAPGVQTSLQVRDAMLKACHEGRRAAG